MSPAPLTEEDIRHRFGYHRADQAAAERHADIREACTMLGMVFLHNVPAGREQSLALTALQEAMMWANSGIAMESPIAPDPRSTT